MILKEKNKILSQLGNILRRVGHQEKWSGYELGINEDEYNELEELVQRVHIYNGWFSEDQVRKAFLGIASWLNEESLEKWESNYKIENKTPKRVAIIMAGNIPLVGFHDFLSVFVSGNISVVKFSSDDKYLFPALIKVLTLFNPAVADFIEYAEMPIQSFDAVIATGSNNSARYFDSYFGKYPHIIRKNRSSMAVLDGTESKEDLALLAKDIFHYYGLGCRNVSLMWVPEDFNLDNFFEAIYDYNQIVNHNKYANNYDYNKAVLLMNLEKLLDNGFIILKEEESLHSPLAVLYYARYSEKKQVEQFIEEKRDQLQVIVGNEFEKFGNSQSPLLTDYADGVDTLSFLTSL